MCVVMSPCRVQTSGTTARIRSHYQENGAIMARPGDGIESPVLGERAVLPKTDGDTHGEMLRLEGIAKVVGVTCVHRDGPFRSTR